MSGWPAAVQRRRVKAPVGRPVLNQAPAIVAVRRWQLPRAARRVLIFGAAGMTGLVVNSLLLWLLVSGAGLGYLLAAGLATQGSPTWNFLWIERLAFSAHGSPGALRRYLQFAVMNNAAMLLRLPVLALLTSALGVNYLVSNALTLLLLFALRFGLSDRFIWASQVTIATAPGAAIVEHSLGRDVASLGLTML